MTPLFSKSTPLQPGELPGYQPTLQNTQGNIVKGHGRKHTVNAFLQFIADPTLLKAAIRALAAYVTSARAQMQQTEDYKARHISSLFVSFGLSSHAYQYLGYDVGSFGSQAFIGGMARPNSGLGDHAISTWEEKFRAPLDAMILLAHDDQLTLDAASATLGALFAGLASIVTEAGTAIYQGDKPKEQFGFVDGISQPLFFQADIDAQPGLLFWDPGAGPNLVLVKDPFGVSDDDCGSYYVFRKLRQDVEAFKAREAQLQQLLSPGQDPALAGALVVGRFRSGTPVALQREPDGKLENNFLYRGSNASAGADPYEMRCPFSAHIRKVNPRGDTQDLTTERLHRIARRGITYGIQGQDNEVGLLFQCCQSSLENQFEFLQGTWINQVDRPAVTAGVDPVVGESTGSNQLWPKTWGTGQKLRSDFGGFVTLRGGGYFFLPSITFLKQI